MQPSLVSQVLLVVQSSASAELGVDVQTHTCCIGPWRAGLVSASLPLGSGLRRHRYLYVYVCARSGASNSLLPPLTVARQAPLFMEFLRQEYWSGLPFPTPGDPPYSGIESASLVSPALAGRFFTTSTIWDGLRWLLDVLSVSPAQVWCPHRGWHTAGVKSMHPCCLELKVWWFTGDKKSFGKFAKGYQILCTPWHRNNCVIYRDLNYWLSSVF